MYSTKSYFTNRRIQHILTIMMGNVNTRTVYQFSTLGTSDKVEQLITNRCPLIIMIFYIKQK